jgi:hypothetical protein
MFFHKDSESKSKENYALFRNGETGVLNFKVFISQGTDKSVYF